MSLQLALKFEVPHLVKSFFVNFNCVLRSLVWSQEKVEDQWFEPGLCHCVEL